ncbi:hypothetical protein [Synechococcus sp. CS-1328]|uniref:hypothetical protein n=1 Tax=Synechococcus sp. CS-1328 TaxID=2847976 RepID=UPI00223C4118|nr:hypothetical protein [Synechococcus sp. CS-1328]MCT0224377.1 hypothetical protein [Synechococcus sp. CS-1328]
MRRIREALRLHLQAVLSYSEVGRALKFSKSAVGKYVSLAKVAGVDCAVADGLDDAELESRLYRPAVPRAKRQRTIVGRLQREIDRKVSAIGQAVREALAETLNKARRIVSQSAQRKVADGQSKLYAWHAPEVDCISKGKA